MKTTATLFTAIGLALIAPALYAQTPDTEVQPLLDKVAAAYRNINALSLTMETTQTGSTSKTKIVLKKPNKLTATIERGQVVSHVVSDGTSLYSDSSRDKTTYIKQPFTKFEDMVNTVAMNGGGGVGLLPILLTSPSAEKQIIPGKPASLKKLADANVGSDACEVVEAVIPRGQQSSRFVFSFGKQDHLLRKLSFGGATDEKPAVVETFSDINLKPSETDDVFKYTPAPGAKAMDPPKEPAMFDPRLKVGAAPLTITGKDLDGKAVSLDQYKGKVLLIDFWATWCGPCVAELPNVIAAYEKYHSKGFEILGVSLDQANAKDKLVSFTKEKKMTWRQVYDGKYWEAENAVAFGVQSIPFTLLIGKDGKIAAVGARGEALAPAIEAALKK
ncbi:MAG TPA: TlpA disulfide reductase family protein [Chthonomonadaceae bacterium]|nr:TlpA disulfide reductase family protein [Chthonomonadaceae bacterium]